MATLPVAPPRTAAQFIDTIGVDSHVSTGAAGYGNLSNVLADLKYLGVSNVRDGDNGSLNSLITMAQAGIKFDFLLAGGGSMVTADIQGEFSIIDQVSRAVAGSVAAVEGANEINNFPVTFNGVGGLQGAVAMQQAIYSLAHADAALPGVAVYYFTGYDAGNVAVGPNPATTAGLADYDNQHPYPQGGQPPAGWVARTQALPNETPASGPAVYTETGYSNTGTFGGSLGLVGQAKYTLDLLMDDAQTGVAHTYLYELMEEGDGFGLFAANNNPNPVATAIHNVTTILADTGTVSATATAANYTISGMPSSGHSMALLKSSGATDIVVWAEPQISASVSGPAVNVVVSLGATYGTVKVFDPLQGTAATQTLTNVGSVTLSLTDHPLIVEVSNGSVAPPPPPPPPPPSPNDTVVLAGSSGAITDASGNLWTITAGGQVAVNGTADPLTSQVTELAYVNGAVWQENTAKLWYEKTSPAASWTPNGGTTTSPLPAPPPLDTLTLRVSEDAYLGDAQFVVRMDGKQVGGTFTASALHGAGDSNVFTLTGNWGQALHDVQIQFLNDAWAGTASTDRNLYVNSIAFDGKTEAGTSAPLWSAGTADFAVAGGTAAVAAPPDVLTVHLSEDALQGNAAFKLTIDGKQITTPQQVVALHGSAKWQDFTVAGSFGAGTHSIGVAFTNNLDGGTSGTGRNLYVNGIDVNGQHYGSGVSTLLTNSTASFSVVTTH